MTKRQEGIYKPTGRQVWYCRYYQDGKLIRKSTGHTDKGEAQFFYEARIGIPRKNNNCPTLGSVLKRYEEDELDRIRSKRTHHASIKSLLVFWSLDTPWEDITDPDSHISIYQYVNYRREIVTAATMRRELAVLSAAAEHSIRLGVDIRNPRRLIKISVMRSSYYWLTPAQATILIAKAGEIDSEMENGFALKHYIQIALNTGMRPSEILRLKIEDISFPHGFIYLNQTKNGQPHAVPISESMIPVLKHRIEHAEANHSPFLFYSKRSGKPYTTLRKTFRLACIAADIPVASDGLKSRMRVYDLRHTFATWLVQKGVKIEKVSDLLNHADIKMTQIYAHHSPDSRADAVKKLPKF